MLMLIVVSQGLSFSVVSTARPGSPVRGTLGSARFLQTRGLRRITLRVPIGCAEGLLLLARELRVRQRARTAGVQIGWRRLSPSAELFIDPNTGARCAIRDTGATGTERYYWTVSVFGESQVAEGRTEELTDARSHAESALAAYIADWRDWPKSE
jgi:hypothetical protein